MASRRAQIYGLQRYDINLDHLFRSWKYGQTIFYCIKCRYVTRLETKLENHVSAKHNLLYHLYLAHYGETVVEEIFETCEICQDDFRDDIESKKDHIVTFHNMTLKRYFDRFVML